jgi:hypothetical protein
LGFKEALGLLLLFFLFLSALLLGEHLHRKIRVQNIGRIQLGNVRQPMDRRILVVTSGLPSFLETTGALLAATRARRLFAVT